MSALLLLVTAAMAYGAVAMLVVWVLGERRTGSNLRPPEKYGEGGLAAAGIQRLHRAPFATGKIEQAVSAFSSGCPCSRVLLATYGPALELTRGEALEAGLRFARDINVVETCGAVTAAFTILALRYPGADTATPTGRATARAAISEFSNQFKTRHTTLLCRQLLGGNGRRSKDLPQMQPEDDARLRVCPGVVRDAAEILEVMLKSKHFAGQNPVSHLAA